MRHGTIRRVETDEELLSHRSLLPRERPRRRRATYERNEIPPPHSITSSASSWKEFPVATLWAHFQGGDVDARALVNRSD
jgi:hypothetical protein